MSKTTSSLTSSLLLGTATGLRSTMGLLAVALSGPPTSASQPLTALRSRWGRRVTVVNAAFELAADKAPATPPRTSPLPLGGRLLVSSVAALAAARRTGGNPIAAVATSAAATTGASFAGLAWRRFAALRLGSDWPGALIEDAASAGVAALAARSLRSSQPARTGTFR